MSFFPVPHFVPPTLEELPVERDEIGLLVALEQRLAKEVRSPSPSSAHPGGCASRRPKQEPLRPPTPQPLDPPQLAAVRDVSRDVPPLGVVRASEDLASLVPEDDGAGPVSASSDDEGGAWGSAAPSACSSV